MASITITDVLLPLLGSLLFGTAPTEGTSEDVWETSPPEPFYYRDDGSFSEIVRETLTAQDSGIEGFGMYENLEHKAEV